MKNLLVVSMMVLGLSAVSFAEGTTPSTGNEPAATDMKHKRGHKKK